MSIISSRFSSVKFIVGYAHLCGFTMPIFDVLVLICHKKSEVCSTKYKKINE